MSKDFGYRNSLNSNHAKSPIHKSGQDKLGDAWRHSRGGIFHKLDRSDQQWMLWEGSMAILLYQNASEKRSAVHGLQDQSCAQGKDQPFFSTWTFWQNIWNLHMLQSCISCKVGWLFELWHSLMKSQEIVEWHHWIVLAGSKISLSAAEPSQLSEQEWPCIHRWQEVNGSTGLPCSGHESSQKLNRKSSWGGWSWNCLQASPSSSCSNR